MDLWKQISEVIEQRKITWRWVKGHNGNPYNERVGPPGAPDDEIARIRYFPNIEKIVLRGSAVPFDDSRDSLRVDISDGDERFGFLFVVTNAFLEPGNVVPDAVFESGLTVDANTAKAEGFMQLLAVRVGGLDDAVNIVDVFAVSEFPSGRHITACRYLGADIRCPRKRRGWHSIDKQRVPYACERYA